MQSLSNPRWLLLTQTLPAILLFLLLGDVYDTIQSQLSPASKLVWGNFAAFGALFTLCMAGGAIYLIRLRQAMPLWLSALLISTHVLGLVLFFAYSDELIPFSIPQWMLSDNTFIYSTTFLMPAIAHGVMNLSARPPKTPGGNSALRHLLLAIGIPVGLYFVMMAVGGTDLNGDFPFAFLLVTGMVSATLLFSYAITRSVYLVVRKKDFSMQSVNWKAMLVLTVIFPVLGLLVNQKMFRFTGGTDTNMFGDFSHPATYILALVNGLLLSLPVFQRPSGSLGLYLARSAMFSFSLYFFLVFLPFLPLSLIAILAIGIGFLMLAPLGVFVVHATALSHDYRSLRSRYSAPFLALSGGLAFLLIPAVITGLFLREKYAFQQALDYVYAPDYHKQYHPDSRATLSVIDYLEKQKGSSQLFSKGTPYLSSWYSYLVMGRQTLSEARITEMKKVFSPRVEEMQTGRNIGFPEKTAILQNLEGSSRYDPDRKLWISTVQLRLTTEKAGTEEYQTEFLLPENARISNYYLYLEDVKEAGILSEKKSALWLFNNIVSERLDPGLLYYASGHRMKLRVFPVSANEPRTTGFELVHPEPIRLSIDGKTLLLGDPQNSPATRTETEDFVWLSAAETAALPQRTRQPYFHFLVDAHEGNNNAFAGYQSAIEKLKAAYPALMNGAQLSLVSSVAETLPYRDDWPKTEAAKSFSGGFFLERALKKSLVESVQKGESRYPVFVVAGRLKDAVLPQDFSDYRFTFPELPWFYHLDEDGHLMAHSLLQNSTLAVPAAPSIPTHTTVRAFEQAGKPTVYLPDSAAPAFVLKRPVFALPASLAASPTREAAGTVQALERTMLLHPEKTDDMWKALVAGSVKHHLLSAATAFIVVENEAQKKVLQKKQRDMLSGKAALSAGENDEDNDELMEAPERMSEPETIWVSLLLGGVLYLYQRRR